VPQVPVTQGNRVALQPLPGNPIQPVDATAGLRAVGKGLTDLGSQTFDYAQQQDRLGEIHDEAVVKEQITNLNGYYAKSGYTADGAFFTTKGKNTLIAKPGFEKGIDDQIGQLRGSLANERQRYLFDKAVTPQRQSWGIQIAEHSDKETTTYAADEATARASMAGELSRLTYLDDPGQAEKHLQTGLAELDTKARIEGWGPDILAAKKLEYSSGVYKDVGSSIAHADPVNGPDLAEAFVKQHEASMTGDDRTAVLNAAMVERHAYEAEQRRQEAEARRAASEARRDARDRVESGLITIKDGTPLKPDQYASLLSDAQLVGDPNLTQRVKDGQFLNGLSIQHQNDTPYQLEARVNELSAKVTKAGANADHNDIIERDHLQSLLGQSRSQLKSDPLGWGAAHLGLTIKPLVLGDPASVQQRISAVAAIRKNTGVPAAPLQPDEIAVAQGTFNHGTTQEKANLVLKLAALGPYALDAAEQVSSNPAIVNAVGIATHSNRGVAASRVNQIVTGYDVLKTKPKLIDEGQAEQQFNQYVGTSLRFLPQVRAGVLSNAKALLAMQANESGASEWGQVGARGWFKAVNSALGAYTKDGKQYGGLAEFNGTTTVLPENMAQDEFESRIAKSNGPEFRKAQNGVPVFADGRSPTATDLKKMQWVPSGDGIYRLSDGNSFLKTKEGGFYEVDVGKLNPSSFDAQLEAHGYQRF
jgi:hypothetical protein